MHIQCSSILYFDEVSLSSGHQELLILKKAFSVGCVLPFSSVVWYTDSTNLISFREKGSSKPFIQLDIMEALLYFKENAIQLHVFHLPREDP